MKSNKSSAITAKIQIKSENLIFFDGMFRIISGLMPNLTYGL